MLLCLVVLHISPCPSAIGCPYPTDSSYEIAETCAPYPPLGTSPDNPSTRASNDARRTSFSFAGSMIASMRFMCCDLERGYRVGEAKVSLKTFPICRLEPSGRPVMQPWGEATVQNSTTWNAMGAAAEIFRETIRTALSTWSACG
jgi:hypothetical protein